MIFSLCCSETGVSDFSGGLSNGCGMTRIPFVMGHGSGPGIEAAAVAHRARVVARPCALVSETNASIDRAYRRTGRSCVRPHKMSQEFRYLGAPRAQGAQHVEL